MPSLAPHMVNYSLRPTSHAWPITCTDRSTVAIDQQAGTRSCSRPKGMSRHVTYLLVVEKLYAWNTGQLAYNAYTPQSWSCGSMEIIYRDYSFCSAASAGANSNREACMCSILISHWNAHKSVLEIQSAETESFRACACSSICWVG